jgi:hypothetical protein
VIIRKLALALNTSNESASQTSALTEFTPTGTFVGQLSLDPGAGAAFGFVVYTHGHTLTVASVDDVTNTLDFRTITTDRQEFLLGHTDQHGSSEANIFECVSDRGDLRMKTTRRKGGEASSR